jgi:hypothetical protein
MDAPCGAEPCSQAGASAGPALRHRQKGVDDHAGVKTPSHRIEGLQGFEDKKVSQEIIRPCWRRIAALLQKQLLFCPRCVMSAGPQQPVA